MVRSESFCFLGLGLFPVPQMLSLVSARTLGQSRPGSVLGLRSLGLGLRALTLPASKTLPELVCCLHVCYHTRHGSAKGHQISQERGCRLESADVVDAVVGTVVADATLNLDDPELKCRKMQLGRPWPTPAPVCNWRGGTISESESSFCPGVATMMSWSLSSKVPSAR